MSYPPSKHLSLAGLDTSRMSAAELAALAREILDAKIHGISFSPYVEGQGPGTPVSEKQIRERLSIIAPYVGWIRTFSCTEGNEAIGRIAHDMGLKTVVGAWLEGDAEANAREFAAAIEVAQAGHADILAIGNEVLLRDELPAHDLAGMIYEAKKAAPGVPVSYAEAYYKFVDFPVVTEACDLILANCYPFWEGCPSSYALPYMKDMHGRASRAAAGKKVIVSETGWPSAGPITRGVEPGFEPFAKYFIDTYQWAEEDDIDIFWFSSFDETWKVDAEGDVGAYWGLWDKDGKHKFV